MKKFLLFLFLAYSCVIQAQYVTIPDSNFKKVLVEKYPTCFNSNGDINTKCPEIITERWLNVGGENISNLEGVQYFENLQQLYVHDNNVTSLKELPKNLQELNCTNNKITELPSLPNSMTGLYCNDNRLTTLPTLPINLNQLTANNNKLTSLPALPNGLTLLQFHQNMVTALPKLPDNLQILQFHQNKVTNLPALPANLISLDCMSNKISAMPNLPDQLEVLGCDSNELVSLPNLPKSLKVLYAKYNKIKCLPFLPSSLEILIFDTDSIRCIPNKPYRIAPYPLCGFTNNPSQCQSFPTMGGMVFFDSNKNGSRDNDEFPRKGVKVTVMPSGFYTYTDNYGYYEIGVDSLKTYTISVGMPKYFTNLNQTATPTFMGEQITKNFPLQADKAIKDLSATLTPLNGFARPGFSLPMVFEVENQGTTTEYGTAYVDFPSDYILDSTSINSVNGNFNFTNLHPGETIKMMVYGRLATTATLGDTLKMRGIVNIYDSGTDSVYSNNISEVKMLIRGSFDPNDKQGPETVTPKQVQNGEFIEYTIRFQNTGTDTAFTVVVADTLTSNLLPETLEMISTSHNCKTTVKGNQVYFEFLNILLPDSNTNEARSHGYVRFKVKPKNTLKLGQSILNTASIYFDYNKPVVTNTVNTKIDEPLLTGIQTVSISNNGLAYPNPVENGRLFVSNARGLKYKLINTQGQLMMNGTIDETGLDVSKLNSGMYMLEIKANENSKVEKIVIR